MKIFWFLATLFLFNFAGGQDSKTITRYLELSQKYPQAFGPKGDWTREEIEIVDDPKIMMQIQEKFHHPIGIVQEDRFWIWIRDAIILPSGDYDTYNRFIPQKGLDGPAGVVVLAITAQREILVNLIYRHATRHWEIELPRGGRNKGESVEAAARREVGEETGYTVSELTPIGSVATDSGIFTNFLSVFFAKLDKVGKPDREKEEAISDVMLLSKEKAMQIFCDGHMEVTVNGQNIVAYSRDSFFAYAFLLAEKKGLL